MKVAQRCFAFDRKFIYTIQTVGVGNKLLEYPSCSSDLALSDYRAFLQLKKSLYGPKFSLNEVVFFFLHRSRVVTVSM